MAHPPESVESFGLNEPDDLAWLVKNSEMKEEIDLHSKQVVRSSRDHYALQEAKALVPIARLVQDNLEVLDGDYQDNILPILVDWFKNEFFSWFSAPNCDKCRRQLAFHDRFINQEKKIVERYQCDSNECDYTYQFIRHNDPAILLKTRQGRCGEWANCFTLILRAMDYDTRLVIDSTDHVWNEVWSETRGCWIHVDTCEGCINTPLLYELGWSKNLEYCLAFSPYEVLDVTRRYAVDYKNTLTRRNSCQEVWLERYQDELTHKLLHDVPQERRISVLERRTKDKDFMKDVTSKPRCIGEASRLPGRKTGSIEWRIQRGEYNPNLENFCVIKVDSSKKLNDNEPLFYLHYSSDRDYYKSSVEDYQKRCWSNLVYTSKNLDFKYERDWKTSYISRYESCSPELEGQVSWRFDLTTLKSWKKIELRLNCKIYPETSIKLNLSSFDHLNSSPTATRDLLPNLLNSFSIEEFKIGTAMLEVLVTLSGGTPNDGVAWQKPQLFRHTRNVDTEEWAFTFEIF